MIQLNDAGDYVRVWQRIVGTHADGTFGPATDAAVKAWQRAHNVDPDGVIGPLTRAALQPGDLIKPYEGLRLHTYDDHDGVPLTLTANVWRRPDGGVCLGYPTIGWGRCLWPGEYIQTCTREEADKWLDEDLAKSRLPAVKRWVTGDAGQICAAASFAYNVGTGALAALAGKGFTQESWLAYNRTRGVVNAGLMMRRQEEFALYSNSTES